MQVQNISFGARYFKSATIKKINENGQEENHKISMVELNPYDLEDVRCVNELNYAWGGQGSLSYPYMCEMNNIFAEFSEVKTSRFFALTQQKNNYEQLDPKQILSIAQTSLLDERTGSLDLLETYFAESHTSKNAKFKHVGQGMLDNIKFLFFGKNILVEAPEISENFYIKNGFEKIKGGLNRLIFRSARYY